MYNFSPLRITLLLLYFLICSACGQPADQTPSGEEDDDNTVTASDINFLGGGTQAPEPVREVEPYRSPTLSGSPPPTALTWVGSVELAVRVAANSDPRKKVIAWFQNEDCIDCRTIERDVFTDPEVIAESGRWVFVNIDTYRNRERADHYLVGGDPPAFVAIDLQGNVYRRNFGPVNAAELVSLMRDWR